MVTARTRTVRRAFLLRLKDGIGFGRIDDSQVQSLAWMATWYKIDAKLNNRGLLWRSDLVGFLGLHGGDEIICCPLAVHYASVSSILLLDIDSNLYIRQY